MMLMRIAHTNTREICVQNACRLGVNRIGTKGMNPIGNQKRQAGTRNIGSVLMRKERPKMNDAHKLSTAEDEIVILQERLAAAKSDNGRHERQRAIDSECIDDLKEQLGLRRVKIKAGPSVRELTEEQYEDEIRQRTAAVQTKLVTLEGDHEELKAVNEHLHSQIDALRLGGQDEDSMLAEQREGLVAAENHRKELEAEIDALRETIDRMESVESGLLNDIRDLKHQPENEPIKAA